MDQKTTLSRDLEFSTFYLGEALFGINILDIQEINKQCDITRVPQASDYVEGILNLRGRIVTIVDLGTKLGLASVNKTQTNRNIIVNSEDEHIGLLVDAISDVVTTRREDIELAPANIDGVNGKCLQGVLKTENQLIGILDLDEVLRDSF